MTAKPFIYCLIAPGGFAMTKRAMAVLVAACLGLASGGCKDPEGNIEPGKTALAVITAPIWIPLLARCGAAASCDKLFRQLTSPSDATKDDQAKRRWVAAQRQSAEEGDLPAQWTMGIIYFNGVFGVLAQDDTEAAKWFRRSADAGYGSSQVALARCYEWGRGVGPDDVQADLWYSIAISTFASDARSTDAQFASESRDYLETRMTPEQIAQARRRAQEWKPSTAPAPSGNGTTASGEIVP